MIIKVYFGVGLFMALLILLASSRKAEKMGLIRMMIRFVLAVVLGPSYLIIRIVWEIFDPPTGNPFDLVYSRLRFYEGKAAGQILSEIKANNESLGFLSVYTVLSCLEEHGFARAEIATDRLIDMKGIERAYKSKVYYRGNTPYDQKKKRRWNFTPTWKPQFV